MDSPFSQFNSIINNLPRSNGSFDATLIGRLIAAVLLLAAALIVEMSPIIKLALLIVSALIAGYDLILDMVDAVADRDFFAAPILLVLIAVVSFLIGYGWEGALLLILFQLGSALVAYAVGQTRASAMDLLNRDDADLAEKAAVVIDDKHAGDTQIERDVHTALATVLKAVLALAVLFAVLMPILTSLSVRESIHRALILMTVALPAVVLVSIPLTGILGISYATHFGVLFNNARVIEKMRQIKTAVIDKSGIFTEDEPSFVGVHSDILDDKTMMEFVAHSVYYSDQPFAKAILSAEDREYRLDLISDFKDIPGSGVDVKIGGTKVTLAKRELLAERGEAVPYEAKEENSVYYLMVSGKYIGKVIMSENLNQDNTELISDLKAAGIESCVLLTEDSKTESERLGTALNADEVYSEFSDETKLRYLESLDKNQTIYLYANSLQAHSNAAIDVRVSRKGKYADALVVPEALGLFPETFRLADRFHQIISENAIFAVCIKALIIFLGLTGNCTVWFAIFLDFAAALAAILNTIRITKAPLIDFNQK